MTGTGISTDPYIITTANDLDAVRNNLSASYKMSANIDMNDSIWNETANKSFTPIGNNTTPFTGAFDGNGYSIDNFYIGSDLNQSYMGLFGYMSGATAVVKNLILNNPYVLSTHSNNFIGCLTGKTEINTNITNCRINNGYVNGNLFVGLLVGYTQSNISYCKANGGTIVSSGYSGGLCGDISNTVSATSLLIKECCVVNANITVSGDAVGGFLGYVNGNIIIQDCYSTSTINSVSCTGGFVGEFITQNNYSPQVSRTFYAGVMNVTGTNGVGGWNSYDGATTLTSLENNFWDIQVSTKTTSKYAIGKTTVEMQTQSTFTNYNFNYVWGINTGEYPHLIKCEKAIAIVPIDGEDTPTYNQNYHNLNSPLFGAFSPLF